MNPHMLFGDFAQRYGSIGREEFSRSFRDPFLEVYVNDPAFRQALGKTQALDEPTLFQEDRSKGWKNDLVAPLVKSGRNDFPDVIMIGRTPVNDIVLPHRSVSKFHAYIKKDPETGEMTLFEGGSSFGTTVEGKALQKGEGAVLVSGAAIVFAKVAHALYYAPWDFYDVMRLKLRAGKTRRL